MKNDFLELPRNHFRFGQMRYSQAVHMAGRFVTPMAPFSTGGTEHAEIV